MCWWCGNDNCTDGEKCRHARSQSPLLNSNTYRSANRRIENATGQRVARAPGVPWGGRRPAFVPGIRDAMMRMSDGICPLCRTAISGEAQVDHTTPLEALYRAVRQDSYAGAWPKLDRRLHAG